MNNSRPDRADDDRFHTLALRYLDDQLNSDEIDEFLQLMAGDPRRSGNFVTLAWQMRLLTTHPWPEGEAESELAPQLSETQQGAVNAALGSASTPEPPVLRFLSTARHTYGAVRSRSIFLGGAVLLTTLVFWAVMGLLVSPFWRAPETRPEAVASLRYSIGRIVNSEGCRWEASGLDMSNGAPLAPGTLHLTQGTAEIVLNDEVTAVIEGPTILELLSAKKVYLQSGKLGATVSTRAIGFTVRTPRATVVDLGTEFDVEVAQSGETEVRVGRGAVEVETHKPNRHVNEDVKPVRLTAGQTIRADSNGLKAIADSPKTKKSLARRTPTKKIESLDLADIVAGGDGRGHRRGLGIDPGTGGAMHPPTNNLKRFGHFPGGGKYALADNRPMVDGVAIINPAIGPVQLNSAGHTFDGFSKTNGQAYGPIWAGGDVPMLPRQTALYGPFSTKFADGIDFAESSHNFIALIPNKLITFDLATIRSEDPDRSLAAFRTVVGLTRSTVNSKPKFEVADVWVFLDDKPCFSRRGLTANRGPEEVVVPLAPSSRFITLAATTTHDTLHLAWVLFGDPRVEFEKKDNERPESSISK